MTLISDVVVPEPMADYLLDDLPVANLMFSSGIVAQDPSLVAMLTKGGSKFSFPFWGDITGTESEIPVEGTAASIGKIGTYELDVPRQLRRKDWGTGALTDILAGADSMSAIQSRVSQYWKTDMQNNLISITTGILESTDGAQIKVDAAAADGADPTVANSISAEHIIDGLAKLGDNSGKFKAMIVPTKVLTDMRKDNLITEVPLSDQGQTIEKYQNMVIINDDNVPTLTRTSATLGNQTVYTTLLVKDAAFAYAESTKDFKPVVIKEDDDLGMGEEVLLTKRMFALHPKGWSWTGTAAGLAPSNAELATNTNWSLKTDAKNSGFVGLYTN